MCYCVCVHVCACACVAHTHAHTGEGEHGCTPHILARTTERSLGQTNERSWELGSGYVPVCLLVLWRGDLFCKVFAEARGETAGLFVCVTGITGQLPRSPQGHKKGNQQCGMWHVPAFCTVLFSIFARSVIYKQQPEPGTCTVHAHATWHMGHMAPGGN